ncbi:MAG: beta-glucanase (GH16 family) [Flavobacteriales bacterium]|jgi:beta-glucanase (GH16 family)
MLNGGHFVSSIYIYRLMKIKLSLLALLIAVSAQSQYTLFWADEFDEPTLDETKWAPEVGGWGWGNNELQYYTDGDNLSFEDEMLVIQAREEQFGQNNYTSGKVYTKNIFEIQYGKIEARIKFPMGQGLWPAFWMLGTNIDDVSWPACGEIDIMEHVNNESTAHGTAHWDNFGYASYGGSYGLDPNEFHVYTIEWDSLGIDWFIDGTFFHAMNIENGINGTSEFQEPFYLILNLAVGGNWPGSPNANTSFPAELLIDYVRVYKTGLPSGVEEAVTQSYKLFPNPVLNKLSITGIDKPITFMEIRTITGAQVTESYDYVRKSDEAIEINLANLASGIYTLRLNEEVHQFIKQ